MLNKEYGLCMQIANSPQVSILESSGLSVSLWPNQSSRADSLKQQLIMQPIGHQ
jgi:hypothetical protein